jgi:hypothetical protein
MSHHRRRSFARKRDGRHRAAAERQSDIILARYPFFGVSQWIANGMSVAYARNEAETDMISIPVQARGFAYPNR